MAAPSDEQEPRKRHEDDERQIDEPAPPGIPETTPTVLEEAGIVKVCPAVMTGLTSLRYFEANVTNTGQSG